SGHSAACGRAIVLSRCRRNTCTRTASTSCAPGYPSSRRMIANGYCARQRRSSSSRNDRDTVSCGLLIGFRQDRDVGEVPHLVVVIETVADDEGIGYVEAAIVRFDLDALPTLLPQKHADTQ